MKHQSEADRMWLEYRENKTKEMYSTIIIGVAMVSAIIILVLVLFGCTTAHAEEYSDDQIVKAIYMAEGGKHAQYPYGIRSVSCESGSSCARICKNTVRNNRKRYERYGYKSYSDFVSFLASRYCPLKAGNDPKGLNANWKRNVNFYLKRG